MPTHLRLEPTEATRRPDIAVDVLRSEPLVAELEVDVRLERPPGVDVPPAEQTECRVVTEARRALAGRAAALGDHEAVAHGHAC